MIKGILSSCLLIIAIILIRKVSQGHIKKRIQYGLWIIVALKLLIFPVPWLTSPMAIFSSNEIKFSFSNEKVSDGVEYDISTTQAVVDINKSATDNVDETMDIEESGRTWLEQTNNNDVTPSEGSSFNLGRIIEMVFIAIWIIGAIVVALKFILQNYMLKLILNENSREYKQKEVPLNVYVVDDLATPCLYNRKIYVREDLLNDPTQRKHVLAHEYCHYRHLDGIWSVVRCICLVVYWWNPLVWLAARFSKTDCELACDESVLKLLGDEERISYGKTLIGLLPTKKNNYLLVAQTMEGNKNSMKDRIKFIANKPKVKSSICVVATFMAVVTLACSCTVKPNDEVTTTKTEVLVQPSEETTVVDKTTEVAKTETEEVKTTEEVATTSTEVAVEPSEETTETKKQTELTEAESEEVKTTGNDYSVCTDLSAIEVENYARKVAKIFEDRNWSALSENLMYPITINNKKYETKEEFMADDWNTIFSNEYIEEVKGLKVEDMWANWQGICISYGIVWLGQDTSGNLKVIAINYATEDSQE